jgi:hypothetical protein
MASRNQISAASRSIACKENEPCARGFFQSWQQRPRLLFSLIARAPSPAVDAAEVGEVAADEEAAAAVASPSLRAVEAIRDHRAPLPVHPVPPRGLQAPPPALPAALHDHRVAAFRAPRKCPPERHRARAAVVCRALRRNVPPVAINQKGPVAVLRNFHRAIVPAVRNVLLTGRASLGVPAARARRNGPRNRPRVPRAASDLPSDRANLALLARARIGLRNRLHAPTVPSGLPSSRANPVGPATGLRNCPANPAPELQSDPAPNPPSARARVTLETSWGSPEALRQAVL